MVRQLAKGSGVWLLLVAGAMVNGVARQQLMVPLFGNDLALSLSGITLSLLVLVIAWLTVPLLGARHPAALLAVGALWVALTLAFEYLFGHYVLDKPWQQIHRVFDIAGGDLFALVLLVAAVAPWLTARLRGLL